MKQQVAKGDICKDEVRALLVEPGKDHGLTFYGCIRINKEYIHMIVKLFVIILSPRLIKIAVCGNLGNP